MPHRELNNANAVKRMTDFVAFGEFWRRLSHLGKFFCLNPLNIP